MRLYSNDYSGLRSGPILREAGAGGSNPLTPTNKIKDLGITFQSFCLAFVSEMFGKQL